MGVHFTAGGKLKKKLEKNKKTTKLPHVIT